ncbi:MAG: protoporphyrinogen/coproporphyrinogen oxidase, partial [Actinomycetota bacterium]
SLLGEESFLRIDRRSGVYSHGVFTEYPFQVNTHGLPKSVIRECVMGFAKTLGAREPLPEDPTFREWAFATFGPGIARHFMIPYNEKLFRSDLDTVSADWVAWSIPKPTWEDVIQGALGTNRKAFGYNPQFLYPREGGIDRLPRALLGRVRAPELSVGLSSVDARRREARLSNGERVRYERLISTMPLPALLARIEDAPREVQEATGRLRYVSVLNLNLGFDAPCPLPYQWVYFAEPRFPFYRAGIYSNLCPQSVPEGHSAFYVEVSHRPDERPDGDKLARICAERLREVGLVPRSAALDHVRVIDIPVAYVVHDPARRELLPQLQTYLAAHGIRSVGRYGAWEYSAMEDALWHGRTAAAELE